jgi:hypothetical protein
VNVLKTANMREVGCHTTGYRERERETGYRGAQAALTLLRVE